MKISVNSTHASFGPKCFVVIDGKTVYSSYNLWQEIVLWEACNHLKINVLDAFKSWLPTSDWFKDLDKDTRKDAFVNYLHKEWIYNVNQLFINFPKYIKFVEANNYCIANAVEKFYYCGLNKLNTNTTTSQNY